MIIIIQARQTAFGEKTFINVVNASEIYKGVLLEVSSQL